MSRLTPLGGYREAGRAWRLEERSRDVRLTCVGRRRKGWGFSVKGEATNRDYSWHVVVVKS